MLLLCTDGLTGEVDDAEIADLLGNGTPLVERAQRLVDQANANGGSDNITVALIPAPADAPPTLGLADTRETPSLTAGTGRAVRIPRRAVWWTGAVVGVFLTLAGGWYWQDRVVEVGSDLWSYVRNLIEQPPRENEPIDEADEGPITDPPQDEAPGQQDESAPTSEGQGDVEEPMEDQE